MTGREPAPYTRLSSRGTGAAPSGCAFQQKLAVPVAKFGEGSIAVAEHGPLVVALALPDDEVFLHLLANVVDNGVGHAPGRLLAVHLALEKGVVGDGLVRRDGGQVGHQHGFKDAGKAKDRKSVV